MAKYMAADKEGSCLTGANALVSRPKTKQERGGLGVEAVECSGGRCQYLGWRRV